MAEALGWTPEAACYVSDNIEAGRDGDGWECSCGATGQYPSTSHAPEPPRYDLNWGRTGPLIERLQITLIRWANGQDDWEASTETWMDVDGSVIIEGVLEHGATPLAAACNAILALHASGKLTQQEHTVA